MEDSSSLLFRIFLKILALFRPAYRAARNRWPDFFQKRLGKTVNLDTSRMLSRFNAFHRLFFRRGFRKIRFDETELKDLEKAYQCGPVVFLMKNWGQVEYNFYNDLFLNKKLPLIAHNNLIKMGHWMPHRTWKPLYRQKIDYFFQHKHWPYNHQNFQLSQSLGEKKPVLYCLNLPKSSPWIEKDLSTQERIIGEWMEAQNKLQAPIQLVPLHFIYDKRPGKEHRSLKDILFGDREDPGYWRKILLFLRNYKKRAVAKIGTPIDFEKLLKQFPHASKSDQVKGILRVLQKTYQHEVHQVTGPKLKGRHELMEEVLEDKAFQTKLAQLAKKQNMSREDVQDKARSNLREICSDVHFTLVELWNYMLSWLFNRFYEGLTVDTAGIAEIKRVAKDAPLILVPSHKSHVDYLIFSYVFYHHDLSLPLVCAGNNLSFWPLGSIFRRSGAYFIRRSFADDPIYSATLKAYVAQLMRDHYFQEFFIEGTRSRSGKLFPPRTGMLKMMVEAFLSEKSIPDVYFVPASIDYERVIEEGAYLSEIKGEKKQKERFGDLFHLPKFLRKRYGKVYIQFASPISLKEVLAKQNKESLEDSGEFRSLLKSFGNEISHAINRATTLLPSSLVAIALLYPKRPSVTSKEVHQKTETLFEVAKDYQPRVSETLQKNFHHSIQESLNQFVQDGLIEQHQSLEENFYTVPDDSRLLLDFYKNRGIHALIDAALHQLCSRPVEADAQTLRKKTQQLLEQEFFFNGFSTTTDLPTWLSDLIRPTLESYWLTLQVTGKLSFQKMESWLLMRKILEQGKLLLLKGELAFPEALSRFNIQNALTQLTEMGVLKNHVKEMGIAGKKYYSPGPTAQKREEAETFLRQLLTL